MKPHFFFFFHLLPLGVTTEDHLPRSRTIPIICPAAQLTTVTFILYNKAHTAGSDFGEKKNSLNS